MKYRIEVSVVVAGRHVVAVERDVDGEGPTVQILSVQLYGKEGKFKVSSQDWEDGKAHIVDSQGLIEWMKWARIGKVRMESMLQLLANKTAVDTELTVTGKVRKNRRIINALKKGRTVMSLCREFGCTMAAVVDQLRVMSDEEIASYYVYATNAKFAVRTKNEMALIEAIAS